MAWRRLAGRENRFVHACIAYAFWEILRRTSTELRRFVAHAQVALRLRHAQTHSPSRTRRLWRLALFVPHWCCRAAEVRRLVGRQAARKVLCVAVSADNSFYSHRSVQMPPPLPSPRDLCGRHSPAGQCSDPTPIRVRCRRSLPLASHTSLPACRACPPSSESPTRMTAGRRRLVSAAPERCAERASQLLSVSPPGAEHAHTSFCVACMLSSCLHSNMTALARQALVVYPQRQRAWQKLALALVC